jgi:hypothetical protein
VQKYGAEVILELDALKRQHTKWSDWTYRVYIDEYKLKLEGLK